MKQTNTLCGQNAEFLYVKAGGINKGLSQKRIRWLWQITSMWSVAMDTRFWFEHWNEEIT
jgi:hypothetical protein